MQFKCTHIHLPYLFVRVGLKCRHTALGNPQIQSWTPCSSGEPEQSQSESKRTWLLGCHTCSGTITSFIYSSNQKNRPQAAEYQFLLRPEPMSGCLKCHWAGRLCISFPASLREALKQIEKAPSNCPATYQGGQVQSCQVELAQWGMRAACHHWGISSNAAWVEMKVARLVLWQEPSGAEGKGYLPEQQKWIWRLGAGTCLGHRP